MKDTLFSPAFGNKPRTLVGRDMDMKCLKEGLDAFPGSKERARLVIGQRGLGKTVLLLELADYARSHGFLVASPTVVSNDMLDRIIEKLNREGERILSQKKSKVTGGTVGFFGFSAGIQTEPRPEPPKSFAARLLDICERAEEADRGILILVDEAQSNHEELKKLIIAYQEMVGEGKNISVVFAGLPTAISNMLNEHVLTFFNRASKLHLQPISIPEISIFYRNCFEKLGIQICDEWILEAAEKTEGSPYMMQLIGHYITICASESGELAEEGFRQALTLAKKEFIEDICETTLSPLSRRDIDFLAAMAQDEGESAIIDIASRLHVNSAYVQRYKTRLLQTGIITQNRRGFVAYAVPYLKEYFRGK